MTGEVLAIERQRDDCLAIAQQRGRTVTRTYEDTITASKRLAKRCNYDGMIADFGSDEFDAIICWHLDRLTRQDSQLAQRWSSSGNAGDS